MHSAPLGSAMLHRTDLNPAHQRTGHPDVAPFGSIGVYTYRQGTEEKLNINFYYRCQQGVNHHRSR